MNKLLIISLCLLSSFAYAGTTVCAGTNIHYSLNRFDFGIEPQIGQFTGERFLSIKGQKIGEEKFYYQEPSVGNWNIQIEFNNQNILAQNRSFAGGWKIYSAMLFFEHESKVYKEFVTCKETWQLVP